jgi:lincosamide nucleotidyltransferase A/C/D/E
MTMSADDVVEVVCAIDAAGVDVWLDGGWGVDALLETETRAHDDLDVVMRFKDIERFDAALAPFGYVLVKRWPDSPEGYVLGDPQDRRVDVHPVHFQENGDAIQRLTKGTWTFPAAGFDGRGTVGGREIRCLTAEVQVLCHAGYELDDEDRRDMRALHETFGVELLPGQR